MNCKNCEKSLSQASRYCSQCGAKVIRNRLTLKNVWEDFREHFLNYDNTFLRTYLAMFKKPGRVIETYIIGTRKKYANPLSYFAIALTLSGFQLFVLRKFFPEALDLTAFMGGQQQVAQSNVDWIYDYYSIFALLNLPIYALIGKLSFIGLKKYNYTEHLVIITYAVAQFSITNFVILTVGSMLGGNFYVLGNLMNLLLLLYVGSIYKKMYPLSLGQILLRTLLFFGILIGILIVVSILQLAFLYFSGGLEEMIEAEKLKREVSYIASSTMNWTS